MFDASCKRENELLQAIHAMWWPERCDDELREHVASCASCSDLAAVATAIVDDRRGALTEPQLPSAAAIWWRARMRRRQEAQRAVARTMTIVQSVLVIAAIVATTLISRAADLTLADWGVPVLAVVATLLLVCPVAAYFALSEK